MSTKTTKGGLKFVGADALQNDDTFEKEHHFDRAIQVLDLYLESLNLAKTTVKERLGASGPQLFSNPNNYVLFKTILDKVCFYSKDPNYLSCLQIEQLKPNKGPTGKDALYLVAYDGHTFVILDANSDKFCIVADESNTCQDEAVLKDLTLMLGKKPSKIAFKNQSGIDHCASSAVVIAIEVMRMFKRKDYKHDYPCVRLDWLKKLVAQFHK